MKPFFLILLFVALPVIALGQSSNPAAPPGLVVSSWSWRQTYKRVDSNTAHSTRLDDLPTNEKRARSRQVTTGQVSYGNSVPIPEDPFANAPNSNVERPDEFQYKIVVENSGTMRINAIVWEYVFLDPINHKEVSRHLFRSKITIKPGEKRKVSGISARRPTLVVRVESADLPDIEQIIIRRVEFSDESVWGQ